MKTYLEMVLNAWRDRRVDPRYFNGYGRISLKAEDYTTRGFYSNGSRIPYPVGVVFDQDVARNGIILQAPDKKGRIKDVAIIGFNNQSGAADVQQIQGGRGRFRELAPVYWDGALLASLIELSRESKLDAVTVVSWRDVIAGSEVNLEKLKLRYDRNAETHGGRWSQAENRYIIEL